MPPQESRPLTQAQQVFNAITEGALRPKEISKKTGIPLGNVNTQLYLMRKSGAVKGPAGKLKARKYPESRRGGGRTAGKAKRGAGRMTKASGRTTKKRAGKAVAKRPRRAK